MEIQIKKTVKAGNSSAVILPRAWLNREVRVELIEKNPKKILEDTINIISRHIDIKEIIGIYLAGSYARNEEDEKSDIDLLVITKNINKEMISEGVYNILIISSKLLEQKLSDNLFPIGQMIKEAKPLINSSYIEDIKVNVTKKNVKWHIDTTDDKLKLIKEVIEKAKDKNQKFIYDRVIYTLVLRIRTLDIIKKLMENKDYSKKEFIKKVKSISGSVNAYESYLSVKNNLADKRKTKTEEAERLYDYLRLQLADIKKRFR